MPLLADYTDAVNVRQRYMVGGIMVQFYRKGDRATDISMEVRAHVLMLMAIKGLSYLTTKKSHPPLAQEIGRCSLGVSLCHTDRA
jgi:hypothetical protein